MARAKARLQAKEEAAEEAPAASPFSGFSAPSFSVPKSDAP